MSSSRQGIKAPIRTDPKDSHRFWACVLARHHSSHLIQTPPTNVLIFCLQRGPLVITLQIFRLLLSCSPPSCPLFPRKNNPNWVNLSVGASQKAAVYNYTTVKKTSNHSHNCVSQPTLWPGHLVSQIPQQGQELTPHRKHRPMWEAGLWPQLRFWRGHRETKRLSLGCTSSYLILGEQLCPTSTKPNI